MMLWMAMLCVCSFAVLEHGSVSLPIFSAIKKPLLYAGGLCILTQTDVLLKNIFKKRFFYVVLVLASLCVMLMLSMEINKGIVTAYSTMSTKRLMLYLVELFALMILLTEAGWSWYVIDFMYGYYLLLVLVTDVLMLTGIIRFISGIYENYLIGTKFSVCYAHMNLITLGMIKYMKDRNVITVPWWLNCVAAIIMVYVSLHVDCMTGVVGSVVLVMLNGWKNETRAEKERVLMSPSVFLMCLLGCFAFPFLIEGITNLPFVKYLVQNVLGRSMDLTGRVNIYQDFLDKMKGHWLLGFGYGSANTMSMKFFGYANAQNALLSWFQQCGILGTSLLITLFTVVINALNRCEIDRVSSIRPLLVLIYVYIFLGTIETTFSMSFILWFAVLFMWINSREDEAHMQEKQKSTPHLTTYIKISRN